ncbi:hypothetical protein C8F01DRAFT_1325571 [Mycena amicta]|nr:hypothetical protein C8F01DRAFT_1325571 [Mycena amicta]
MTESESAECRQTRWLAARDELTSLDQVLCNTPDPYGQLSLRRDEFDLLIASFAVAPHAKLPSELLADIFTLCSVLPEPTALPLKANEILLILTHVCSAWRTLALHLPELWSNISVTLESIVDPPNKPTYLLLLEGPPMRGGHSKKRA